MNRGKRSTRGWILGALLAMSTPSLGVPAYQQPPAARGGGRGRGPEGPKIIEVEKLRDSLFVLRRTPGRTWGTGLSGKTWPILDGDNGGSAAEVPDTLAKAARVKAHAKMIYEETK
jgi:hypothetical protein